MKNKIMQKTLSWVLSSAMVLSMSSAIPAMATNVYAGVVGASTIKFADQVNFKDQTVYLGQDTTTGLDPVKKVWTIGAETKADSDVYPATSETQKPASYANYDNTFTMTDLEKSILQKTTIAEGQTLTGTSITVDGTVFTPMITDPGVDDQLFYLDTAADKAGGAVTRDFVKSFTKVSGTATAPSTDDYFVVSDGKNGLAVSKNSTTAYSYVWNTTIDFSDRSKVLFAMNNPTTGTDTYNLALIDSAIPALDVSSVKYTGNNTATVTFKTAIPEDYDLGWFTTDSMTLADATKVDNTGKVTKNDTTSISKDRKTLTLSAAGAFTDSEYLFVSLTKDDAVTGNILSSTPVSGLNLTTPTAENFVIDSSTAAYKGQSDKWTANDITGKINNFQTDAQKNNKDMGTVTLKSLKSGTDTYDYSKADSFALNAGTYEVYGDVTSYVGFKYTTEGDPATSVPVYFSAAKNLLLGTLTIAPITLGSSDFTFTNVKFTQYSDATKSVDALAIQGANTANGTLLKTETKPVTVKAAVTITDQNKTKYAVNDVAAKYVLTNPSSANYVLEGGSIVLDDGKADVVAAVLTGVSIKSEPDKLYYVEGAKFDPAGLVLEASYEGTDEKAKITYDDTSEANFSFTPSLSTTLLTGEKEYTVSYTDPSSKKTFKAPETITVTTLGEAAPLTKIAVDKKERTIDIGQTADLPEITYTPADTTDDRYIVWKLTPSKTVTFSMTTSTEPTYNDIFNLYLLDYEEVGFVDEDGNPAEKLVYEKSGSGSSWNITINSAIATDKAVAIEGFRTTYDPDADADQAHAKLQASSIIEGVDESAAYQDIDVTTDNYSVDYARISGTGRYETSAATIKEALNGYTPSIAVLASGENFADALAADGLAGALSDKNEEIVPVLLTAKDKLPAATAELIKSWEPTIDTIYIVGGPNSVSNDIIMDLKDNYQVRKVTRLAGADRTETANTVYTAAKDEANYGDTAIVATGSSAADAISVSSASYAYGYPLFLTVNGELSEKSLGIIEASGFSRVLILGGKNSVSAATEDALGNSVADVERLSGANRYETSLAIADYFTQISQEGLAKAYNSHLYLNKTAFTSGNDKAYTDALSAGLLAGIHTAPVILVDDKATDASIFVGLYYPTQRVDDNNVTGIYFIGGENSIAPATVNAITMFWNNSVEKTTFNEQMK